MSLLDIAAILLGFAAFIGYLNLRLFRLPSTVGLMLGALVFSLGLLLLGRLGLHFEEEARALLSQVDFTDTVLHGLLSFLLFAGALHIDLNDLRRHQWVILTLATVGVVLSMLMVGFGSWYLFSWMGFDLPLIWCLLFGALIAPTDPIAVLGILKSAGAPRALEIKIAGESLFNDGVAVVLFLALLGLLEGQTELTPASLGILFLQEAVGGVLFGLLIGYGAYLLLRTVDDYAVEITITLALVTGGYALAEHWHLSAPITVVVAGLLVGNHGRRLAMSERTVEHLDTFWELLDELLNAVLFVLIGLELLVLQLQWSVILAGMLVIPLVLIARMISVGLPIGLFRLRKRFEPGSVVILTWGGLRGGISIALALALPAGLEREFLLTVTYVVVVFSILVQGLTIGPLVRGVVGGVGRA
ncbi:MAG: sodium:proton antiporter [Gammaproteobacteria bacterium]|nr:MAG: sodium:proton antiporter [Gammaproteobacteria bacterium]